MSLPAYVWHLKGSQTGPKVILMGGTHGDELTGAQVVREILKAYGLLNREPGVYDCSDVNGDLFLVFGNPEAMLRNSREATGGAQNLNRAFTPKQIYAEPTPSDSRDIIRARELAPLLQAADYLFDFHATHTDSVPFVCFGNNTDAHRALYRVIPVEYIINDPDCFVSTAAQIDGLGTTDSWVNTHGGVGLCYETGFMRDVAKDLPRSMQVAVDLLETCGSVQSSFRAKLKSKKAPLPEEWSKSSVEQQVYNLVHCELVDKTRGGFAYASGVEEGIWQDFAEGSLAGTYADGSEVRFRCGGKLLFVNPAHMLDFTRPHVRQSLYCIAQRVE